MRITISGRKGEGKTTLASEIQVLLESLGLAVQQDDPDVGPEVTPGLHELRTIALRKQKVVVTIRTETIKEPAPTAPVSCNPWPALFESLPLRSVLPKFISEMFEDELAQRVRRSYLVQDRVEQRRRLRYVVDLSAELHKIEQENIFSVAFGLLSIEAVMEGDWREVLDNHKHLSFEHESQEIQEEHEPRWRQFREILKAAFDTRPIQGVQKIKH